MAGSLTLDLDTRDRLNKLAREIKALSAAIWFNSNELDSNELGTLASMINERSGELEGLLSGNGGK